MHLALIGAALMALYASRFENALRPYAAGMSIGAHPEVTAATLPIPSVVLPPPVNLPTSSDAVPLVEEQAAAAQGGGGGGGSSLLSMAAPLALRLGANGLRRLLEDSNTSEQASAAPASMDSVYSNQLGIPAAQSMDAIYSRALGVVPTMDGAYSAGLGLPATPSMDALYSAGVQNPTTFDGMAATDLFGGNGTTGFLDGLFSRPDLSSFGTFGSAAGSIVNFGMGKAGSLLGNSLMGSDYVSNPYTQLAGSLIGSIFGPVGTFVGSMLGGMIGDRANIPRSFVAGENRLNPDGTVSFGLSDVSAVNGGPRGATSQMSNMLSDYINQRAAAEGYTPNPDAIGRLGFYAGMDGDQLYYSAANVDNWRGENGLGTLSIGGHPIEPQNTGLNFGRHFWDYSDPYAGDQQGLANFTWGDLVGRGIFVPNGTAPTWDAVQGQRQAYLSEFNRPDMWSSQWGDNGPVNVSNPGWSFQQGPTYDSGQWVQQALNAPTPNLEPSGA